MDSRSGVVRKPLKQSMPSAVLDDVAYERSTLFDLPTLCLEVKRLKPHKFSAEVYETYFSEHHYMRGQLPSNFHAVVVRDQESGRLVAMDAIGIFFGNGNGGLTWVESRLVLMPQWQGYGIGPKLSEKLGSLLLASGQRGLAAEQGIRVNAAVRFSAFPVSV